MGALVMAPERQEYPSQILCPPSGDVLCVKGVTSCLLSPVVVRGQQIASLSGGGGEWLVAGWNGGNGDRE